VMNALELISAYKTGHMRELHGTVVVVGAGNTAIDAANAARGWARRRSICSTAAASSDIPAFDFEYEHAKQEGVQFLWRGSRWPFGREARWLLLDTVQVQQVDRSCCRSGFGIHASSATWWCRPLASRRWHSLCRMRRGSARRADRGDREPGKPGNPRYFAGGDCVNGGREVVDAVAEASARRWRC
jgi:dihydropyrimidine dehydrogenase (NAD+) subunit PreT